MRAITTSHGVLEPQVAAHAHEMFALLSDPAIYEFENAPPVSAAWLAQRFERLESRASSDGAEQWLNWVIRLPSGELAGYVQATMLSDRNALVAYELHSRHWRQGIGGAAVDAVLRELQSAYGVALFVAVLKAKNYRSEGLLRKLGFVQGSDAQHARYRDEPDEMVLVNAAAGDVSGALKLATMHRPS
jgi:[ribosomal protein S5]-alanine N-acetyltransferase